MKYQGKRYSWMGITVIVMAALLSGCATFGIGEYSRDQAVLEAAAGAMMIEYLNLEDVKSMSKAEIANALLRVGDESVQIMGYVSFASLVQSRINNITNGKMNPQVLTIYMLTIAVLESLEDSEE